MQQREKTFYIQTLTRAIFSFKERLVGWLVFST
jgi:hypothetical protein